MNRIRLTGLFLGCCASLAAAAKVPAYDVLIENGHVVDGSGAPWYAADIGIRDGHVVAIGRLHGAPARQRIDAHGRVVAPGFIDMLGQSEFSILVDPRLPSKVYQGITTEITGEGNSAAPTGGTATESLRATLARLHLTADWTDFRGYFRRLEQQHIGINLGSYVGATTLRKVVVGDQNRPATAAELAQMRRYTRAAMADGALGVSSSLEYAPAPYASTEELTALASEAGLAGGIYATHMRSEGDGIDTALEETFRIGRDAHVPVEIWHLKVAGKGNWGRMPAVIAKINAARESGVDVAADTYAYTAWFNDMSAFVPPWAHDGGDARLLERLRDPATRERIKADMRTPSSAWDNEWQEVAGPEGILIGVIHNPALKSLQGKTIAEVAAARQTDPMDTLLDILADDEAASECAVFGMNEPDVALALEQPWMSINNDSSGAAVDGLLGSFHPHPRAFGTFPRILRKYVREEHRLTLEEAIRKFTSLPASRLRLNDRGLLKNGMWADVVIFDPQTVTDRATYAEPNQLSSGMDWVLVNGVPVIADGRLSGALPGRVLRGPGYASAVSSRRPPRTE